jgi:hypothetical protein
MKRLLSLIPLKTKLYHTAAAPVGLGNQRSRTLKVSGRENIFQIDTIVALGPIA